MSQADELLNSLSEEDIMPLLSNPDTEPHIVIGDDRVAVVPEQLKRIAVQYDHNIETVTFDCPRYWDEHDMSQMSIYINYRRKDRVLGSYQAKNIMVDETDPNIMHFDWTISRNVSLVVGKLQFLVCIKKADDEGNEENHWNSELNEDCFISEGLEADETFLELYPDLISQWAEDVEEVKQTLLNAKESGEFDGEDGFSPSITVTNIDGGHRVAVTDANGTNTFDVMDGASPTIDTEAIDSGHQVTVTDANGTNTFAVMDGADGISPTITVIDTDENRTVEITDVNGSSSYELLNGVSPIVAVETIAGGHRVTITDVNDSQTFDVMDGSSDSIGEYVNGATATDEEINAMLTEAFSALNA